MLQALRYFSALLFDLHVFCFTLLLFPIRKDLHSQQKPQASSGRGQSGGQLHDMIAFSTLLLVFWMLDAP